MSGNTEFSSLTDNDQLERNRQEMDAGTKASEGAKEQTPLQERREFPVAALHHEGLRNIVVALFVFSVIVTIALVIQIAVGEPEVTPHGGVATCTNICSEVGVAILKDGGSAVDAAIASMLCVGVVTPQYAGVGGGGFMQVHEHTTSKSTLFDFREVAPSATDEKAYHNWEEQSGGEVAKMDGLYIGIPGEVAGMYTAHKQFGRLPWSELFAPTIKLAKEGFPLPKSFVTDVNRRMKIGDLNAELMTKYVWDYFRVKPEDLVEDMHVVPPQETVTLFEKLSKHPTCFYDKDDDIAQDIVDGIVSAAEQGLLPGVATLKDVTHYKVQSRDPLIGSYGEYDIITFPSPSSGAYLLLMLNLMEDLADSHMSELSNQEVAMYNHLNFSSTVAYPYRDQLGDPKGRESDMEAIENEMINKSLAHDIIEDHKRVVKRNDLIFEDHGTSHISVIDPWEQMVAVTHTLNFYFGSLIRTPKYGILLNNQLQDFFPDDFSSKEPNPNRIAAGRRPRSSMVPTIVHHHKRMCGRRFAVGGVNGTRIVSGVAEVIYNLIGPSKMSLSKATNLARMYCPEMKKDETPYCEIEKRIDPTILERLEKEHGLNLLQVPSINVVQTVMKDNDTVVAVSDDRNGGKAVSF